MRHARCSTTQLRFSALLEEQDVQTGGGMSRTGPHSARTDVQRLQPHCPARPAAAHRHNRPAPSRRPHTPTLMSPSHIVQLAAAHAWQESPTKPKPVSQLAHLLTSSEQSLQHSYKFGVAREGGGCNQEAGSWQLSLRTSPSASQKSRRRAPSGGTVQHAWLATDASCRAPPKGPAASTSHALLLIID